MDIIAKILVLLIAVLHIYILVLEMYLWDKPLGRKAFGLKQEFATSTKVLAANQGLYNGFLAVGLLWGLLHENVLFGLQIQMFFLSCVFVAGLYGAYSSSFKILLIQSVPSLVAMVFVVASYLSV